MTTFGRLEHLAVSCLPMNVIIVVENGPGGWIEMKTSESYHEITLVGGGDAGLISKRTQE